MANKIVEKAMLAAVVHAAIADVKLYPLTKIVPMEAKAGGSVDLPTVKYIGDADAVEAGVAINPADFTAETVNHKVIKAAKAMKVTQEDMNNSYIDLQEEAEFQLGKAIKNKVEIDLMACLGTATLTAEIAGLNGMNLPDALIPFGDALDEKMYIIVNPAGLAEIRKDDAFVMNASHTNNVNAAGMLFDMEVIVSAKVPENTCYVIKEGALALYLKKDAEIEMDKDIVTQTYNIVATQHYVAVLNDASKAIKVTIATGA